MRIKYIISVLYYIRYLQLLFYSIKWFKDPYMLKLINALSIMAQVYKKHYFELRTPLQPFLGATQRHVTLK